MSPRTKSTLLAAFFCGTLVLSGAPNKVSEYLAKASELRDKGDFKGASATLMKIYEEKKITDEQHKELDWQLDHLERVRHDYSLTRNDLFKKLSDSITGLANEEFDSWIKEGRFDHRMIDGEDRFVSTGVPNLYYRYPDLNPRRRKQKDTAEQRARLDVGRTIVAAAKKEHKPYVLPRRLKCTMHVTAKENAAPDGSFIRAWLPIPRKYPFQTDIKILDSTPVYTTLAPENSPIRSAYFEEAAHRGQETKFEIIFEYTAYGVHFETNPNDVVAPDLNNPELMKFTSEAPHVVFSDKIKKAAEEVAGQEKNPLLKAKLLFDWVATEIKYSYAREYSTFTNISDFCFANRYGDCGQEALLFITLCRAQGIPARWQSGWNVLPGAKDMHDWCEIYVAPYGWMPCDPWAGIFAMRYCDKLNDDERRELRDFYFCGLDQYRMIANGDHSQPLTPAKRSLRSDDVDFQRGELEWGSQNIYFPKFSYDLVMQEVKK